MISARCSVTRIEDRGWKTEDGGLRIEDGGWKIEDRGLRIEDRGLKIEDRGLKIEDRPALRKVILQNRCLKDGAFIFIALKQTCKSHRLA